MTIHRERSVIVSLWSAGSCGRKQLAGILDYINAGHLWNVRIIMDPGDLTEEVVARAEKEGVDGLIAFSNPSCAEALARTSVPTVLLSYPQPVLLTRRFDLVMFLNRNEEIGRRGADYFLSLGAFASYAFVPDAANRGWSPLRERGFVRRLAEKGLPCDVYRSGDLAAWLAERPKPVAVMTPFDFRSNEVLDACRKARLNVPSQVAVLGVDDDELICDSARPTLSSIRLDQEAIGRKAAETLDRLMSAKKHVPARKLYLPTGRVVERESTRPVPPAHHLVSRLKALIDAKALSGANALNIAASAGVSRRLADLRLKEATGQTVRQALENRRLDEISRRLRKTNLPISKITRLCGYENDLWVKYVFRRRFGMTMRDWRRTAESASSRR